MEAKMYSVQPSSDGGLVLDENKGKPSLPLYSRVYGFGQYMEPRIYAVVGEPDKYNRQRLVSMGTPSEYEVWIDKYSRPVSKKFGIGTYYDDMEPDFRFPEDKVKEAIEKEKAAIQARIERERKEKEAQDKELAALPGKYPFLKPVTSQGYKEAKANLVAYLKHEFPGVRFSVRKDHTSTYIVRWIDGPTEKEVDSVAGKFQDSHSDYTGDFWDYDPSLFNRVFGGFSFVFCYRDMSPGVEELCKPDFNTRRKIFYNTSFPVGAINIRFENDKFIYDLPEKPKTDGITIIDYSDKAIAVIGDTKPIKDTLKELGGRFNYRLKCGPGWIFPKSKENEIKEVLS